MIGPAVAGLVIAKIGTGWAFLVNGLSFGAVLLSMYLLRIQELSPNVRRRTPLCMGETGPPVNPGHALSDRDIRSELPDLHLHHGGE